MRQFDFQKYRRGIITVEVQSMYIEKIINLLWKNNINGINLKRKNITTICFDVNLRDYDRMCQAVKKTDSRMKIVGRKGISFFLIKNKRRKALLGGIIIFIGLIYYLSTFIWSVDITTENNVTPYEIRSQLKSVGVIPGVRKNKINVYEIEEKILQENSNVMWARARIEGSKLVVSIAERQEPPNIIVDNSPCNIVAKKDGEIVRLYSEAGTAVVKSGDIVKKGDLLVKGEQGKEGATYLVHAKADVIARTFYEEKTEVPVKYTERKRTGNTDKCIYIEIFGKKIFIKKAKNKFKAYDKILTDKSFIKQEEYFEVDEKVKERKQKEVIDETTQELMSNIIVKLDKSVKIIDKIVDYKRNNDKYQIRVVLVVEEDIGDYEEIKFKEEENDI